MKKRAIILLAGTVLVSVMVPMCQILTAFTVPEGGYFSAKARALRTPFSEAFALGTLNPERSADRGLLLQGYSQHRGRLTSEETTVLLDIWRTDRESPYTQKIVAEIAKEMGIVMEAHLLHRVMFCAGRGCTPDQWTLSSHALELLQMKDEIYSTLVPLIATPGPSTGDERDRFNALLDVVMEKRGIRQAALFGGDVTDDDVLKARGP